VSRFVAIATARMGTSASKVAVAGVAEEQGSHNHGSSSSGGAELSPVDKLSNVQLEEFFEAFTLFDKDGGGTIDASELKEVLASVGQMPTDAELADMISAVDADGTGDIDFTEFAALMAHKMQADEGGEKAMAAAFSIFDASGDGLISSGEMRKIMINLGEKVTAEDVEAVIRCVDTDGDGFINYKEFSRVILDKKSANDPGDGAAPLVG